MEINKKKCLIFANNFKTQKELRALRVEKFNNFFLIQKD